MGCCSAHDRVFFEGYRKGYLRNACPRLNRPINLLLKGFREATFGGFFSPCPSAESLSFSQFLELILFFLATHAQSGSRKEAQSLLRNRFAAFLTGAVFAELQSLQGVLYFLHLPVMPHGDLGIELS